MGPFIRSDHLRGLREFLTLWPQLTAHLPVVPRVRLVIDANYALEDVLHLSTRNRTGLRTSLEELLAAGSVVAVAPPQAVEEVERHLNRRAAETGVPTERVWEVWAAYRARLLIVEPASGARPRHVPDEDDLPYVWLQDQIGAVGIASRNAKHLEPVGGRTFSVEVLLSLRDYTREVAVEVAFVVGTAHVTILGFAGFSTLVAILRGLLNRVRALPPVVQVLLMIAAFWIVASPERRARIMSALKQAFGLVADIFAGFEPQLVALSQQYQSAQRRRPELKERVDVLLTPPLRPRTARAYALGALLTAGKQLTTEELLSAMRREGYSSAAQNPAAYLRRLLRRDARVEVTLDGRWGFRLGAAAAGA